MDVFDGAVQRYLQFKPKFDKGGKLENPETSILQNYITNKDEIHFK
jgi:hypothetical protein